MENVEMSFDAANGGTSVGVPTSRLHGRDAPHGGAYEADVNPYAAHQADDDDAASVGDDSLDELHEKQVLPVADEHGNLVHYPGEEDQKHHKHKEGEEDKKASKSVIGSGLESLKYLYSIVLLIFSVVVVMAAIFSKQTNATGDNNVPPGVAFVLFWFLIIWLAFMEADKVPLLDSSLLIKPCTLKAIPKL
jgi:hypothetical protein